MPGGGLGVVEARPVDVVTEAAVEVEPRGGALALGVRWVGVDPVLEGVDGRDPREQADGAFHLLAHGAVVVGGVGIEALRAAPVGHGEQLHGHGGDLGELDRAVAVVQQGLVAAEHGVEGVAGLVDHGLDVAVQAGGVHEDEGHTDAVAHVLVAAGRFALSAVEIEVVAALDADAAAVAQLAEHRGEARVELLEGGVGLVHQVDAAVEGAERCSAVRVDGEVPWSERVDAQRLGALGVESLVEGHDRALDRVVEREAVLGRVVEAVHAGEGVPDVVVVAGVAGELVALGDHLVVEAVELLAVLQAALADGAPRGLAAGAVGIFEEPRHLGHGALLALEVDGLCAGDGVGLLAQLVELGLDGHVLVAVELDVGGGVAREHAVAVGGQREALGELLLPAVHREHDGLGLGRDGLDELREGVLRRLVARVAGGRDVEIRLRLAVGALELAAIKEPRLEIGGRLDRPLEQRIEQRLDVGPLGRVELGGNERAAGDRHGSAPSINARPSRAGWLQAPSV